jgi:hypothetical protein
VKWKIFWSNEADEELANIWLRTSEKDLVSRASAQIERELAADPTKAGESRSESTRVVFCLPLVVTFVLHPEQRAVQVTHVRAAWKRKR